jgi:hypothetical protein
VLERACAHIDRRMTRRRSTMSSRARDDMGQRGCETRSETRSEPQRDVTRVCDDMSRNGATTLRAHPARHVVRVCNGPLEIIAADVVLRDVERRTCDAMTEKRARTPQNRKFFFDVFEPSLRHTRASSRTENVLCVQGFSCSLHRHARRAFAVVHNSTRITRTAWRVDGWC